MNNNESVVYKGGKGLSAIQIIGQEVWGYPVLSDESVMRKTISRLLDIFKKQEIGVQNNKLFVLDIKLDDGYQKIKKNNNKVEVQMHHALKAFKRPKDGGSEGDYEQMEGLGDYVEIQVNGKARTFVTSAKGSLKLRDVETGHTYVMTPEGLEGPFEYGCGIFQADVDGGLKDKMTFVMPYTQHGGIAEDDEVYTWVSE